MSNHKVPQHSHEAEAGLIGSILMDYERCLGICVEIGLAPEAFYVPAHRIVYEACLELHGNGKPINLITLGDELKTIGKLDITGGRSGLEALVDACPTSAHARNYAEIVNEKYKLRQIVDTARQAVELSEKGLESASRIASGVASELLKVAQEGQQKIDPETQREQRIASLNDAMNGIKIGIASRWHPLSNILGNYRPKKLIIWGARPSCGKTTAMLNEAITSGEAGEPVGIHSLEMPEEDLRFNMACSYCKVSTLRLICGHGTHEEIKRVDEAYRYINTLPIHICDKRTGIDGVESWMTMAYEKWGIKMYWLDYLTMIRDNGDSKNLDSWSRMIGDFVARIQERGKRHNMCMNLLAQLSRTGQKLESENTPAAPTLESLRDSGEIEQYADVVNLLCKTPDTSNSVFDGDNPWPMEWNIAKHRGGPTGRIPMVMIRKEQRYVTKLQHEDILREKQKGG